VALAEIRSVVAAPVFDPATTSRRFTISAGSYFCPLIVRLITLVRRSAPGVSLQIVHLGTNLTQALDQQEVDLALAGFERIPARFRSEWLFQDELAWVIGSHHRPSEQPPDHDAFLTWPLVGIVAAPLGERSRERLTRDDILLHAILDVDDVTASARRGPTSLMVNDALTAMAITTVTDMVALVPRRYAETWANSAQIRIVDLPKDRAETIDLSMLWHNRVHEDPGSQWLRSMIREAVKLHFEAAQPRDLSGNKGVYGGARMKSKKPPVRSGRDRNKVVVKLR
jgi:DNA-binding transcriptional LysR family regulator